MMNRNPAVSKLALAALAVALAASPAPAQEGEAAAGMDDPAMMEAMMKAMSPGAPHAYLAKLEGTWTAESTAWMEPGAEPLKSTGASTKTMVMDGRYLQEEFAGDFNGMPFEGRGLTGYDNTAGRFVGTWFDSMSTGILMAEGGWSEEGKSHWISADFHNPMTGQKDRLRMVTRWVDADRHVFEYYVTPPGGEESKQMEIVYVRK